MLSNGFRRHIAILRKEPTQSEGSKQLFQMFISAKESCCIAGVLMQ